MNEPKDFEKKTVPNFIHTYLQRRHRINPHEIDPAKVAFSQRLIHLLSICDPEDIQEARSLFRLFFRLNEHVTSRPVYPPHEIWSEMAAYLNNGFTLERDKGVK